MKQDNGISQAHIDRIMLPFSSTNMNRSNYGKAGGFGQQAGFGINFYNQQVYKPIRGGGGGMKGAHDRSGGALNFSEFMET